MSKHIYMHMQQVTLQGPALSLSLPLSIYLSICLSLGLPFCLFLTSPPLFSYIWPYHSYKHWAKMWTTDRIWVYTYIHRHIVTGQREPFNMLCGEECRLYKTSRSQKGKLELSSRILPFCKLKPGNHGFSMALVTAQWRNCQTGELFLSLTWLNYEASLMAIDIFSAQK